MSDSQQPLGDLQQSPEGSPAPTSVEAVSCLEVVEFPKAIPAKEWYQYPPIEAGRPWFFIHTRLDSLDVSVRVDILGYVTDKYTDWNVTEYRHRGAPVPIDAQYVNNTKGLLGACQQLRKETLARLMTTIAFTHCRPQTIFSLPDHIGETNMSLIRYLKLSSLNLGLKWYHEGTFPNLLDFLCTKLPNLLRFQMHSQYSINEDPIKTNDERDDPPPITRHQQEVRVLLRFGAFLAIRNPRLDLLIWRPDSGLIAHDDEDAYTHRCYIEVAANCLRFKREPCIQHPPDFMRSLTGECDCTAAESHILNATQIRRQTWSELAHISLEELILDPKSEGSELIEEHDHFWSVDKYGYMTRERQKEKEFKHVSVDHLIMAGRKRVEMAEKALSIERAEKDLGVLKETGKTVDSALEYAADSDENNGQTISAKSSW